MKRALSTCLAVPLLLAFAPAVAELGFHPESGTTIAKEFKVELDLAMDDLVFTLDGQDMGGMVQMDSEPEINLVLSAEVTDTYNGVSDGRPTDLVREFGEVSVEYDSGEDSGSETVDELEGTEVRFRWNDEEEEYDVSFVDEDSDQDEEVLQALGEDMDLRALLPPDGDPSEGESWEVATELIPGLLLPGIDYYGGLDAAASSADIDEQGALFLELLQDQLTDLPSGFTVTCQYKGTREADGGEAGVIAVELAGSGALDLAEVILEVISMQGAEMGIEPDISHADLEIELEGEGELLWSLEGGHVLAFEMSSDVAFYFDAAASIDAGGEVHDIEGTIEFSGSASWSVEASAE